MDNLQLFCVFVD